MSTRRVALVTGSTSGIGLTISRRLAEEGYDVILTGLGEQQFLDNLKEEFNTKYGIRAEYVFADLSKPGDIDIMCTKVKDIFPLGVDVLINNAGFQHVSPVEEFPDTTWDAMLAVMLTAPFLLTKRLLPDMKSKHWGGVINISSAHGVVASPNKAGYVSCKHGIIGLTKVVALETAATGVTCNAICPGYVDTPILQGQVECLAEKEGLSVEEARGKFLSQFHPTESPVGLDQIAGAVMFLCSDSASQMTGSNLVMDGGYTAR